MTDLEIVRAPRWDWMAVGYFYLGGLAGGSYALAAVTDLFGRGQHRAVARWGYRVAFSALLLGTVLLIIDLMRPERFWHMLLQSERGFVLMLKWWSPMSVGAWALFLFGGAAFLSLVGTLAVEGRFVSPRFAFLRQGAIGRVVTTVGAGLGFFVAAYTGVLISVTNRPLWSETTLWGLVFVLSSASTAAALLLLLLRSESPAPTGSVRWLADLDARVIGLEVVALVALVLSLGGAAGGWWNGWGLTLALGVVGLGMLVPLALRFRGDRAHAGSAVLLRVVVVMSVEGL
jgi:formate-dependent nitrite reductase membrane component NrfD